MTKAIDELFRGLFANVIGQTEAKKKLKFYLGGYLHTRKTPYFMLAGPKGSGKSLIARELAHGFVKFNGKEIEIDEKTGKPKRKIFVEVNASAIKSVSSFVNIIISHVIDKDVTFFIDEAHNLDFEVTNALLTILNPGADKTQLIYDDYVCDFDHTKISFIFASSEVYLVFPPLLDRMCRVDLSEYSNPEMAQIVKKHSKDVEFEDGTLEEIVKVLRASARSAAKFAEDVRILLNDSKRFQAKHWKELKGVLGINPLGLSSMEITLLKYLKENLGGVSLTRLSAKTGFSRESLRQDLEMHLMKSDLMIVETTGRQISAKGLNYLKELDALKV